MDCETKIREMKELTTEDLNEIKREFGMSLKKPGLARWY